MHWMFMGQLILRKWAKLRRCALWLSVVLGTSIGFVNASARGTAPTSSELIKAYIVNAGSIHAFHVTSDALTEVSDQSSGLRWVRTMSEVSSDGERLHITLNRWRPSSASQASSKPVNSDGLETIQYLWDGKLFYEFHKVKGGGRNSFLFMTKDIAGMRNTLRNANIDNPLSGLLSGDSTKLSVILQSAASVSVRPNPEKIEGANCWVLEAKGRNGKHILWLDPARNCAPIKVEVQKGIDDLFYGRKMSAWSPGRSTSSPSVRPVSFATTIQFDHWRQAGSAWIPMTGSEERRTTTSSGLVHIERVTHTRNQFDIDPSFAKNEFVPSFPDGTRVFNKDVQAGLRWEWRAGKAIPAVSNDAVTRLNETISKIQPFVDARVSPHYRSQAQSRSNHVTARCSFLRQHYYRSYMNA